MYLTLMEFQTKKLSNLLRGLNSGKGGPIFKHLWFLLSIIFYVALVSSNIELNDFCSQTKHAYN